MKLNDEMQQIARILCANYTGEGYCLNQEECEFDCWTARPAKRLYEAGYRKQRHGEWSCGTENGARYAKCSACGRKMDISCYGYAYCSLCGMDGAKMKGGAE